MALDDAKPGQIVEATVVSASEKNVILTIGTHVWLMELSNH